MSQADKTPQAIQACHELILWMIPQLDNRKQIGVTLIELTVVLLILVALAGVVIPYVGGTSSTALCNATDVTMQNVKKVIMERYYLDTLGYFPVSKGSNDYNLKYLFEAGGWQPFNPETQIGWRGSYLQGGVNNEVLDGWGRPISIQVDSSNINNPIASLVSEGAVSGLANDDRILYLNTSTPDNPPCNEN